MLKRETKGCYVAADWHFVLERRHGRWELREQGRLLARKPRVLRTHRSGDNSAREAVRWAHRIIRGDVPIPTYDD